MIWMMVDFMIHEANKVSSISTLSKDWLALTFDWFRFDHLRREASEYEPYEVDEQAEPWRAALEKQLTDYIKDRYPHGACTVVGTSNDDRITLSAYVESHKFEAKNFW